MQGLGVKVARGGGETGRNVICRRIYWSDCTSGELLFGQTGFAACCFALRCPRVS